MAEIMEGVRIGSEGALIVAMRKGTVSIDPGSIATVTRAGTTFALPGAKAGDVLVMQPPAALNDDLLFVGCDVTADDVGTVYLYNPTGSGIDDTARTWRWFLIDATN